MKTSSGAPAGFEERLDVLFDCARQAAMRVLRDWAEAEDIAEETMVRVYVKWSSVADHAEPWVTRVATNLAISEWRHRQHVTSFERNPSSSSVVAIADHSVERVDLERAMSGLSKRQREVITLRYLFDMSEADVASALRCSSGSVSRHSARALVKLRVLMATIAPEVQADV